MKVTNEQSVGRDVARNFRQLNSELEATNAALQTQITALPQGKVASATVTTSQAGITTAGANLTGLSLTFTAVAGRMYKVTAMVRLLQNTSNSVVTLRLRDAADVQISAWQANVNAGIATVANVTHFFAPSAGSYTCKLFLVTSVSTIDMAASSTAPAVMIVEDVGVA